MLGFLVQGEVQQVDAISGSCNFRQLNPNTGGWGRSGKTWQLSGLFLEVISPLIYFQSVIFWQCSPEAILDNKVLKTTWFNWNLWSEIIQDCEDRFFWYVKDAFLLGCPNQGPFSVVWNQVECWEVWAYEASQGKHSTWKICSVSQNRCSCTPRAVFMSL